MFSPPPLERFEPPQQQQEVAPEQVQPEPTPMSNGHGQPSAAPTRNAQNGFQNGFTEFVSSSTTKVGYKCTVLSSGLSLLNHEHNQSECHNGQTGPGLMVSGHRLSLPGRSKEERLFSICVTSILFRIQTNRASTAYADLDNLKVVQRTAPGRSRCP